MPGCLRAIGFYSVVGQRVYSYAGMAGDKTLIGISAKPMEFVNGSQPLDPALLTLGTTSLDLGFAAQDEVWIYIPFYES